MSRLAKYRNVVAFCFVFGGAIDPDAVKAQDRPSPHAVPLIAAISAEDTAVIRAQNVAAFSIQNRGTTTKVFSAECAVSAELLSCTVPRKNISLRPGKSAIVIVRYHAGSVPGAGMLTLRSRDQPAEANASLKVILVPPPES